jgi:hypothetical protein
MDWTGINGKTFSRMDDLISKIRQKAAREMDHETYGWADRMDALLQHLSVGMQLERESGKNSN